MPDQVQVERVMMGVSDIKEYTSEDTYEDPELYKSYGLD
jgi:hypothetical protein